ncbi:cell surface hyaluronidase [Latimeria chalumnae]|uniref:cell surface hyaluronidase n=1 Tax=Latimeria chalumnae TaxID=7897 RepID=UPI0006D8EF24|nr:PREDICTED: transmembrane protein 2 [Latimeria chalumnae]|eukprot:XP_014347312.1 PREDICTED: transmembrane protein 2 [Latimeria chalumnae]
MQEVNTSRHPPIFLQPQNSGLRTSAYVPGKVAPVRPAPPPKIHASAKFSNSNSQDHTTFTFPAKEPHREIEMYRKRQHRNTLICFAVSSVSFFLVLAIILGVSARCAPDGNCPDQNPLLSSWNPGHDEQSRVVIKRGDLFRLDSSATVHSITIQEGGQLVFADDAEGSKNITLRTRYILIKDDGELHIGAEKCPYKSKAAISLYGRSDDGEDVIKPIWPFGMKFIGVEARGTLEVHGTPKLSWTLLAETLPPSGLEAGAYSFEKSFNRGLHVRVIDPDTAQVLTVDRFDTYDSYNESKRLQDFLRSLDPGRIVAFAVGDSADKSLLDETKLTIEGLLGSSYVKGLSYRQAWALVGVIGGKNTSCSEEVRDYENHSTGGKALARRQFVTVDGVKFAVLAYSEWSEGVPLSGFQVEADGVVLNLVDDAQNWMPGDRIVMASTDYSMYQAEEFSLLPCPECNKRQVKIKENPQFLHIGEIMNGIDMRAEVGVLTRNIIIKGEVEDSCYSDNWCQFFDYDTFGGHIKILTNFTSVHLSNIEIVNMGQQKVGSYPVHFHLCGDVDQIGGYESPTYVEGLAIHHCFSRCVTLHTTNGLLIKNTIGYDTLGHCFFMEDGIEQRNTLYHNFGLVTRPGALFPTDRDDAMCTSIRDKVYGNYIPVPTNDCKAVSTFWIAHPNNHLISNAAAGSQDTGIWYLFHETPTRESQGLYPEAKAELTPLGIFYNNRVHSNFKGGLFIDKGVKTTNASAEDPREYLCLDNSARFRPHQDADPQKPRVAAVIDGLIAFKNNNYGAWIRGGDVIVKNSGFADNGIGLTFASDGSFPNDEGSSQEVTDSLFVGESGNHGFHGGQNKYYGIGGLDNKTRTLPKNKTFPIRGFQIYDGPIHVTRSTFKNFVPTAERYISAIGFLLKNQWQMTPKNNISLVEFDASVSLRAFFGKPGPWFEDNEKDGDKNSVFHDVDGSVTGYRDTYVGRIENYLIRHPSCVNVTQWNGVICSGKYAQIYIHTWYPDNLTMSIVRDEYPVNAMEMRGVNQRAVFQPVVMLKKGYTVHWNGPVPKETVIYLINFDKDDWIRVGLCYPPDTIFQVTSNIYRRQTRAVYSPEDYGPLSSLDELQKQQSQRKYYFDKSTGLLFLFLQARHSRDGHSYCSTEGCERIKILATTQSTNISHCMAKAYPKYSQKPTTIVPMPSKARTACKDCGAVQRVFTSDHQKTYLSIQIQSLNKAEIEQGNQESFISVNGTTFLFKEVGFFVIIVDACTGGVIKERGFSKDETAKLNKYLQSEVPQRSVVLLSTRGALAGLDGISETLMTLGITKAPHFHNKESLAFFGFRGDYKPSWIKLATCPAGQGLGKLEKYIPLQLEEYSCTKVFTSQRKDLKLLKKALSAVH